MAKIIERHIGRQIINRKLVNRGQKMNIRIDGEYSKNKGDEDK